MSIKRVSKDTVKGEVLHDLAGPFQVVVTGGAAATNLTATGLKTTDKIVSAIMYAGGVPSVVTEEASITADDVLQLSTTDSTSNVILVTAIAG